MGYIVIYFSVLCYTSIYMLEYIFVLNCSMYVIIIYISWLYCINMILRIRYCKSMMERT